MRARLWFLLLALGTLLPSVGFAQVPTITVTPKAGSGNKIIFNLDDCADQNTEVSAYSLLIDFGINTPIPGTTFDVFLGVTCDDNDDTCQTLVDGDALSLSQTSRDLSLDLALALEAIGAATCEATDERLKVFVDVNDAAGTRLATGSTKDDESVFVDTIIPEAPLNPSGSGGENNIKASWDTNPENDGDGFVLGDQEAGFQVQCRFAGDTGDFIDCGGQVSGFESTVEDIDGVALENGIAVEFVVVTIDPAGNRSAASAAATATPQDVLDFGENYGGGELGGCAVSQSDRALGVIVLALAGLLFIRRRARLEVK